MNDCSRLGDATTRAILVLLALLVFATAALAEPEVLDAFAVEQGRQAPADAGWGEAFSNWKSPKPIIDLAARAYGGSITTSSSVESGDWSSSNLGDGLPSIYSPQVRYSDCVHCGWLAEKTTRLHQWKCAFATGAKRP